MNPCTKAVPKDTNWWQELHKNYIKISKNSKPDVVWIGDSIVEQIQNSYLWKEKLVPLNCVNLGIGGDRVEHVLWRIENGELDFSCKIKVVVLHVGTNNISQSSKQIFEGILHLVEIIKTKVPDVVVIIPTLLPKGQYPNKGRITNEEVNELLNESFLKNRYHESVAVVPIHKNIVQKDGTISKQVLHDYLHLTNEAYGGVFEPVFKKICSILNENYIKGT